MTELAAECQLCLKERIKAGLEPNRLHALERAKKSDGQGRICPDCDGGALELAQKELF
jgi:hypothetical protein